jgi:integrase
MEECLAECCALLPLGNSGRRLGAQAPSEKFRRFGWSPRLGRTVSPPRLGKNSCRFLPRYPGLSPPPLQATLSRHCDHGAPKSKHGRRIFLLPPSLARKVRTGLDAEPGESTDLFFRSDGGGFLDADGLRRRTLKPLVEKAGAGWAAFHTFRHTFASIHIGQGTDIVALSRALGHHSPAFTLSRYAHLLPGELAPPLDLAAALIRSGGARSPR